MTESLRFHNLPSLPKPPGYTHVVEAIGPGRLVYISGQLGQDRNGVLATNFRAQAHKLFENLSEDLQLRQCIQYCAGRQGSI